MTEIISEQEVTFKSSVLNFLNKSKAIVLPLLLIVVLSTVIIVSSLGNSGTKEIIRSKALERAPATPNPKGASRVFVTSTSYNGNLGGLAGADAKCQQRANTANLGGSWKAWLSDSVNSASSRLIHSSNPYILINGTIIADNWTDLTDGSLDHIINITEQGVQLPQIPNQPPFVWTATTSSGNFYYQGTACSNNWTSGSNSNRGAFGQIALPDSQWSMISLITCGNTLKLYCFEQIPNSSPTPTPILNSGCVKGQTKPYYKKVGTVCTQVNSCGISSCSPYPRPRD